tara:strand:+ start:264 stop:542 length:279 start_codon:yes stop_codon:yes gene_type:complete
LNITFNDNKTLRVFRAKTPEALTAIVRSISLPLQIMGFGSDDEGHYVYYRTTLGMSKRVEAQANKHLENLRGGEASPKVSDRDVATEGEVSK